METEKRKISFKDVRQIDLVDYLSTLGFHPVKIRNADHWYLSPLRTERTASFKVNRRRNQWYDHGIGEGGGILQFGALFHHCSRREFLQLLNDHSLVQPPNSREYGLPSSKREPGVKILSIEKLTSYSLLKYIHDRRIPLEIAECYCRQITFDIQGKRYSAIGFQNNMGGFELRNRWFKGSSAPKAVTSFVNHWQRISVFEGFFDFLTYLTLSFNQGFEPTDFLILNSISHFEKSRVLMETYPEIHLFLDRDKSGKALASKALSITKQYKDQSQLYKGYTDLNEWVQEIGKSPKKGICHDPR